MALVKPLKRLRLESFNNLTKSLSFNLYDVCYAKTADERKNYIEYIDEEYNADVLTEILTNVTKIIGANILNIARQDYEPQGASVTILVCEEEIKGSTQEERDKQAAAAMVGEHTADAIVGHLDKSHITVHTYPEYHPYNGICTFRADIEVSTCGQISPLHALNFLIEEFQPDVLNIDYRVRGFTRDVQGRKHYIDHKIHSVQNFVDRKLLKQYQAVDVNVNQERLWHTKMMWRKMDLDRYLHGGKEARKSMGDEERKKVKRQLRREIQEIFEGGSF